MLRFAQHDNVAYFSNLLGKRASKRTERRRNSTGWAGFDPALRIVVLRLVATGALCVNGGRIGKRVGKCPGMGRD
jgi:hypothetical protein